MKNPLPNPIDEILHTFYEDILVSESELSEGDRKTSLEIADTACKEATQAIQDLVTSARINELSYFAQGAKSLIPRKDLVDRINQLTKYKEARDD